MWANYDYSQFPIVKVIFNENIESEEDFNLFLKKWVLLYEDKKDFKFIFDVSKVSSFQMSYVFTMRKFIKKIKQFPHQYLQQSLIIVSNKYVKYLLSLVFSVQKPVAPVYIYNKTDKEPTDYDSLLNDIENNRLDKFKIVKP